MFSNFLNIPENLELISKINSYRTVIIYKCHFIIFLLSLCKKLNWKQELDKFEECYLLEYNTENEMIAYQK